MELSRVPPKLPKVLYKHEEGVSQFHSQTGNRVENAVAFPLPICYK